LKNSSHITIQLLPLTLYHAHYASSFEVSYIDIE
jgi:hypothetical protein